MSSLDELKSVACEAIDKIQDSLLNVNKEIWKNPELNFEERHAHKVLTGFLQSIGFSVERSYLLDTAYRCVYVADGVDQGAAPNVAIISEYDALPGIGHACGHNLIAEAGVAAAVGVKAAMDAAVQKCGKLTVLGTPAEEGGGGKVDMIRKGAFESVDVAMMVHPFPANVAHVPVLTGVDMLNITYEGKASHAAAAPWEGVNALDAAITCYQAISNLRQQMKPNWRVHGIIKNGGEKANIIPEKTELEYYMRTMSVSDMKTLKEMIVNCVNAAAQATGCKVDYHFQLNAYESVLSNTALAGAFERNATSVGVDYTQPLPELGGGSTDMGNVSHIVPSIHPFFSPVAGSKAMNHTREFTDVVATKEAHLNTLLQAKAMAMTTLDIFYGEELLQKVKSEFEESIASGK